MNFGNRRCTKEEIEEMKKLWKEGLLFPEIGRRLNRDHSTVAYWLTEYKSNIVKQKGEGVINVSKMERKIIKEKTKEEKQEEEDARCREAGICIICKKEKEPKWRLTKYCSLPCWDKFVKITNPKWHRQENFLI